MKRFRGLVAIVVGLLGLVYLTWSYTTVPDLIVLPETLDVDDDQACAVEAGGTVACWGDHISSQLGSSRQYGFWRSVGPLRVPGISDAVDVAVVNNGFGVCAVEASGQVSCWGGFSRPAELREDVPRNNAPDWVGGTPVAIQGLNNGLEVFGTGSVCARRSDQSVSCATAAATLNFEDVPALRGAENVYAGRFEWCGLFVNGDVSCVDHQTSVDIETRYQGVADFRRSWNGADGERGCLVYTSGASECWNNCRNSQDCEDPHAAVNERFTGASLIFTAGQEFCGVFEGRARCLLNYRDESTRDLPLVNRPDLGEVVAVDASLHMACVANRSGQVHCWGDPDDWQIRRRSGSDGTTPRHVLCPFRLCHAASGGSGRECLPGCC